MEWMAETGFSLGHRIPDTDERYWPVPPLGVFYAVVGDELQVIEVVDRRRRDARARGEAARRADGSLSARSHEDAQPSRDRSPIRTALSRPRMDKLALVS